MIRVAEGPPDGGQVAIQGRRTRAVEGGDDLGLQEAGPGFEIRCDLIEKELAHGL